ncbi:MAG: hypothetical protein NT061_12775 [Spirochaetes bacterium]|nr:hypothetical protein [Spirochaetota bacterium]
MDPRRGFPSKGTKAVAFLVLAFVILGGAASQDATTFPTPAPPSSFLDFPGRRAYHQAAGWTSTGLVTAVGAIGAWRALDFMNRGHEYRDAHGIDEENKASVAAALSSVWANGQILLWVHAGLLEAHTADAERFPSSWRGPGLATAINLSFFEKK